MKNTSQGYPRNYTANTTGDILQVAEKIYFMAKVSTTPYSGVKLPVIWHSYATGLLFENSKYNMQLTLDAVNQAFDQSPYIKKS